MALPGLSVSLATTGPTVLDCATMCYMSEREQPARVGVRELRQNLSIYLDRVKAGETLEVTVKASSRDCYAIGALAAAKLHVPVVLIPVTILAAQDTLTRGLWRASAVCGGVQSVTTVTAYLFAG